MLRFIAVSDRSGMPIRVRTCAQTSSHVAAWIQWTRSCVAERVKPLRLATLSRRCGLSLTDHPGRVQTVEVVYAFFLLHAVAAPVVAAGVQIALYDLANVSIFDLHLVAESDALLRSIGLQHVICEIPLEDDARFFGSGGDDDVQRHV